jgi:hypothetical protein
MSIMNWNIRKIWPGGTSSESKGHPLLDNVSDAIVKVLENGKDVEPWDDSVSKARSALRDYLESDTPLKFAENPMISNLCDGFPMALQRDPEVDLWVGRFVRSCYRDEPEANTFREKVVGKLVDSLYENSIDGASLFSMSKISQDAVGQSLQQYVDKLGYEARLQGQNGDMLLRELTDELFDRSILEASDWIEKMRASGKSNDEVERFSGDLRVSSSPSSTRTGKNNLFTFMSINREDRANKRSGPDGQTCN